MRTGEERRSRMRIDRTAVKDQAVRGSSKGSHTVSLPEGVKEWRPDKEGEYAIRILPYTVTQKGHPDDRPVGSLWYRRPFRVHFSVGGSDKAVVCPKSFGKPCPICQEIDNLYKDGYDKNKKVIDAIKATKYVAFAAYVEGVDGMVAFTWNESKFAEKLEKVLKRAKPENLGFADSDEGRMLILQVVMEEPTTKEFKAYLTTDQIDFADAGELAYLSDEVLETVPKMDEIFKQMPYEQLTKLFHGIADDDEEAGNDNPEPEPAPAKPAPARAAPAAAAKSAPATRPTPTRAAPPPPPAEKQGEGEMCSACNGTGKNSRGRVCVACNGTGIIQPDLGRGAQETMEEEPAEEAPPPKPAPARPAAAAKPARAAPASVPSDEEW